jgi:3-oxoacyl-[acyl-carrier protein] reductase
MTRVALVSGGGRGIGKAISLALAEDGCDVAVNYRKDVDAAEQAVKEIEALGRRAVAVAGNVGEWDDCVSMVDKAVEALGPMSILVHNGGIASRGNSVVDTDPAEFDRVVKTHLYGGFYLAKLRIPHMEAAGGRGDIVMISSVATDGLAPNSAPYNAGKSGLEAVTYGLAKEVQRLGIHVNIVAPGLVATDMGDRLTKAMTGGAAGAASDLDATAPFGHVCRPEEVADVVRWLCSDGARYVHGVRIRVDGGGSALR